MIRLLAPALLLASALLTACTGVILNGPITGSGRTSTVVKELSDFTKLEVGSAFQLELTQADEFSVEIDIDDNLVDYLEVIKRGDTLSIGMRPRLTFSIRNNTLRARVKMPRLAGLNLSGASSGTVSGFDSTDALTLNLSGASTLKGSIRAGDLEMELSGASNTTLEGAAGRTNLDASGASRANLADFTVGDTRVEASGASNVTVTVDGKLDLDVSGASRVVYLGDVTLGRVNVSGASSIGPK